MDQGIIRQLGRERVGPLPTIEHIVERYGKQRYLGVSLFLYLLVDAFFPDSRLWSFGILTLMIVTGPLATGKTTLERVAVILLALLMLALGYGSSYESDHLLYLGANAVGALFFFSLVYLISRALLVEQTSVTGETLWAAINVYLLIGMLFAFLYTIVALVYPGAFSGSLLQGREEGFDQTFVYYSFVTMTTLGYGDITPKVQVAAALAYLQALIGQLYVAILIARLVSLYSSQAKE